MGGKRESWRGGSPTRKTSNPVCQRSYYNCLPYSCEMTKQLQSSRENNKTIQLEKINAEIKAKAGAYLLTKKLGLAHSMVCLWLDSFFADKRVVSGARQGAAVALLAKHDGPAVVRVPAHPHGFPQPVMHRGVEE